MILLGLATGDKNFTPASGYVWAVFNAASKGAFKLPSASSARARSRSLGDCEYQVALLHLTGLRIHAGQRASALHDKTIRLERVAVRTCGFTGQQGLQPR